MKLVVVIVSLLALGGCTTIAGAPGATPAKPLNCAYADSHCARGGV